MGKLRLLVAIGISMAWFASASADQIAEVADPVTVTKAPEIRRVEPPQKGRYAIGETIEYRIIVEIPETDEEIRLSPPNLDLENLELVATNQETVTSAEGNSKGESVTEQILNFRFTGQKPGPARIKHFSLKWIYGNGALTSDFSVPSLELIITPARISFGIMVLPAMIMLFGGGMLVAFLILRKKKSNDLLATRRVSLEESVLDELGSAYMKLNADTEKQSAFLADLRRIFGAYLRQKLDWNPARVDYNELQKKLEEKWSKTEAKEIKEILVSLDYGRFSGAQADQNKSTSLYQAVRFLIERRKGI